MHIRSTLIALLFALPLGTVLAAPSAPETPAGVEADVAALQHEWEIVKYRTPEKEQASAYEQLAARARDAVTRHPDRAEPLVWEGIIVSSWAGAKGGLGALSIAKQAKTSLERAIEIRPDALDGSAYGSLGVLYYKVPGWPIGFGSKDRARELLEKALAINPQGIDPNFFYAEYLLEQGQAAEATRYLETALKAPERPGRQLADSGRREEAQALLAKARKDAN
jgi:tetratricopeptide (TPR) repeat protein